MTIQFRGEATSPIVSQGFYANKQAEAAAQVAQAAPTANSSVFNAGETATLGGTTPVGCGSSINYSA